MEARAHGERASIRLYISPLKALAVDIERNLEKPIGEMGLAISVETRTGDTSASRRQRQKMIPPDILLTTPEQLALLIAAKDAVAFFSDLREVVLDELHALVTSKRGDLLALGLARLRAIAPDIRLVGLSATVADPDALRAWLVPQAPGEPLALADLVVTKGGAAPEITILDTEERVPWSGHSAPLCGERCARQHRPPQDGASLRQHPQPGRTPLLRTLAAK